MDSSAAVRRSRSQGLCLFRRTGRRRGRRFLSRIGSPAWIARPLRQDVPLSRNRRLVPYGKRVLGRRRKSSHPHVVLVPGKTWLDQSEGGHRKRSVATRYAGSERDRVLSALDERNYWAGIFPPGESSGQGSRRRA